MKKLMTMMLTAAAAFGLLGDEEVKMIENQITSVNVTFPIRSYTPSNKEVVRIEKTSDTALRLTALKQGRCDLEVRGDMDMTQKFQIEVGLPLARDLATLRRELERMPEVHADIVGERIKVEGEVKTIKKWNYLMKVLKSYSNVNNFAEFEPGPELLLKMKENLVQCGFEVAFNEAAGKPEAWKANCVALSYNKANRTLNVQAKVFTPDQQAQIVACIEREKNWILIDKETKDSKTEFDDNFQVRLNKQIFLATPMIRLSVAYLAIGDEDIRRIGNSSAIVNDGPLHLTGIFDVLQDLIHGDTVSKTASVGANLGVTTRFLAQNGLSRVNQVGYTQITSWDKEGAMFKSGGTLYVKVEGRDIAELKEIPYGFTINAKGGMTDESTMAVNFDFGSSTIRPSGTGEYDRKEDLTRQKVVLPLNRTTFISGLQDVMDKNMPASGLPYLRNCPMLNWFVADSGKELTDRKLMIMVCPEIVDSSHEGNLGVDKKVVNQVLDNGEKPTDQRLDEQRKAKERTGFWSWLDWFGF